MGGGAASMDGRGSIAGICDNVFSNSSSSKPRPKHQGPAICSRSALAAAICEGNTVRAFSNRHAAQTPAQSGADSGSELCYRRLKQHAVPEEARCGSHGDVSHAVQSSSSAERTPKNQRGATAHTLRGMARGRVSTRFPRELFEWCVRRLAHVKNPGSACIQRLRTCISNAPATRIGWRPPPGTE
jgi:hypothetical protein